MRSTIIKNMTIDTPFEILEASFEVHNEQRVYVIT